MQNALTVYFDGEKYAGLLLAGAAVAVIVAAVVMYRAGAGFRSFALTLGIIALAEIALGVGLYLRTGPQVSRLERQLRSDRAAFQAAESARMDRVQKTFVVIEYVELCIIIAAAVTAVGFRNRVQLAGVALGLAISASILLAFDVFAERRGAEYVSAIERLARPIT
jgi:hypothetical protein